MFIRNTLNWSIARSMMIDRRREGVRMAAEYMVSRAVAYCPVDTGLMISRIMAVPQPEGDGWRVVVDVPYAPFVEFGHHTPGGKGWVPPNPLLRNAAAETDAAFKGLMNPITVMILYA